MWPIFAKKINVNEFYLIYDYHLFGVVSKVSKHLIDNNKQRRDH